MPEVAFSLKVVGPLGPIASTFLWWRGWADFSFIFALAVASRFSEEWF